MTRIVSRNQRNAPKDEGKTLFEHIGFTSKGRSQGLMDRIGKYLKSMALFVIIGYLIGTILDIMLEANFYAPILAIAMLLIWILKVFGTDLTPPKKKK